VNSDPACARSRLNYGVFLRDQASSEPNRGAPANKVKALHEASLAQIRKAIELDPNDANYRLQLALTLKPPATNRRRAWRICGVRPARC
jgi:hypothetical protein